MYLHLGASVVIPLGDVLGIFDLDNTTSSRVTRDFLARAQQAGQVVSVGEDAQVFSPLPEPGGQGHRLPLSALLSHPAQAGGVRPL